MVKQKYTKQEMEKAVEILDDVLKSSEVYYISNRIDTLFMEEEE